MKQLKPKLLLLMIILTSALYFSCGEDDSPFNVNAVGQLIDYDGCKNITSAILYKSEYVPSNQDCIEYVYDSTGTLTLTHVNAAFNCCPDDIVADIQISNTSITIDESEENGLCDCLCLYDVEYKIVNLSAGSYSVEVEGLYLGETLPLQFDINLTETVSGSFCFDRAGYPWETD